MRIFDLDRFLAYHNVQRTHQGYRLKGRAPAHALCEALGIEELPRFTQPSDESEPQNRKEEEAA